MKAWRIRLDDVGMIGGVRQGSDFVKECFFASAGYVVLLGDNGGAVLWVECLVDGSEGPRKPRDS